MSDKRYLGSRQDDVGLSPVVGVILMVAITIILASVIMIFLTGMADLSGGPPAGGVTVNEDAVGVSLTFASSNGRGTLSVVVDGSTLHTWNASEVGETITIAGVDRGSTVKIISDVNGDRTVVQTYTVESNFNASGSPHLVSGGDGDGDTTGSTSTMTVSSVWTYGNHSATVTDVAVASSNKVYSASLDDTSHRINSTGDWVWNTSPTAPLRSVAVNDTGAIYVAGGSPYYSNDDRVSRVAADGTFKWTYTGLAGEGAEVVVDSNGYAYAVGTAGNVTKLSPTGSEVWRFNTNFSEGYGIAIDSNGNVYAAGRTSTGPVVIKLNNSGVEQWRTAGFNGGSSIRDVTVGASGDVYAVNQGIWRLNASDGSTEWSNLDSSSTAYAVATGPSDDVYVGWSYDTSNDTTAQRLDRADGSVMWNYTNFSNTVRGVTVDSNGYVYAATGSDQQIVKLNQSG